MPRSAQPSGRCGCLYLVATPIGNLEDITLRALRVLREADLIACEDTRQTQKLLRHYGLRKRLVSYHEHNEMLRAPELVMELERGARVALVSDAGMPVLSDPGHRLVALCVRHGIPVVPVPGPSAVVAALVASGLPVDEFVFVGFLPARAGERRRRLQQLAGELRTLVLFEAPHRIRETVADALELLGDRPAVLAREVTKLHEEFLRGRLSELRTRLESKPPKGEITLLIGPAADTPAEARSPAAPAGTLAERIEQLMREQGLDRKTALKQAARERGLSRREAYKQLLLDRIPQR
ncbi:MAG: 16S rRNA (cytidine(1402)-2'-O)-methyltransferase [Acidobacteriia bacterium]|jgi:16S rRNA (cytidine1402-2'-O)-methyltransferase|nr:16S rRNA (cytidine(1402)-2'-O)-methyltransferase [Terriglobia bacterium]